MLTNWEHKFAQTYNKNTPTNTYTYTYIHLHTPTPTPTHTYPVSRCARDRGDDCKQKSANKICLTRAKRTIRGKAADIAAVKFDSECSIKVNMYRRILFQHNVIQEYLALNFELWNGPRSYVNMLIDKLYSTSYLMAIITFFLSVTIYEIVSAEMCLALLLTIQMIPS